jgi:hypothetical protein
VPQPTSLGPHYNNWLHAIQSPTFERLFFFRFFLSSLLLLASSLLLSELLCLRFFLLQARGGRSLYLGTDETNDTCTACRP